MSVTMSVTPCSPTDLLCRAAPPGTSHSSSPLCSVCSSPHSTTLLRASWIGRLLWCLRLLWYLLPLYLLLRSISMMSAHLVSATLLFAPLVSADPMVSSSLVSALMVNFWDVSSSVLLLLLLYAYCSLPLAPLTSASEMLAG